MARSCFGHGLFKELLPESVICADSWHDVDEVGFPVEEAAVVNARRQRRAEYRTVRALARRCLVSAGQPPVALPRDADGAPRWPTGWCGSLTHCRGVRAAAVARIQPGVHALGIDAEPNAPLPAGVWKLISTERERRQAAQFVRRQPEVMAERLLFSAKESLFKACSPDARGCDYHHATVALHEDGCFHAELHAADLPAQVVGRWALAEGLGGSLIVTAVVRG